LKNPIRNTVNQFGECFGYDADLFQPYSKSMGVHPFQFLARKEFGRNQISKMHHMA
jgi:hypothetical protein